MATDDSKFEFDMIDFQGRGYHGLRGVSRDEAPPKSWARKPWFGWACAFSRAKAGDFSLLPELVALVDDDIDGRFVSAVSLLVGDAGAGAVFASLLNLLDEYEGYDPSFEAAAAIAWRGRLGDIPKLLSFHRATRHLQDHPSVPKMIARMVDPGGWLPECGEEDIDAYSRAISARVDELATRLGSADVCVWMGEPASVRRAAELIIERAPHPHFPFFLRRRFEANTGIDCSAFYADNHFFQPLTAIAICEEFLDSDAAKSFADGTRYFYGHPLPSP
jgi:hypothetical protein